MCKNFLFGCLLNNFSIIMKSTILFRKYVSYRLFSEEPVTVCVHGDKPLTAGRTRYAMS